MRLLKNVSKNRTDRPVFNTDTGYAVSHQQDLKRIYEYLIYDISRVKAGRERRAEEIPRDQPHTF